jgi:hypothetical protein
MSDHIRQTIADVQKRVAEGEKRVLDDKRLANQLAQMAGLSPVYGDAELQTNSLGLTIRSDQFYGQPFATSVRDILMMRKALNQGAASINEIHAALVEGGFAFETKNEDNAKRGMRISIAKNNVLFHKLPSGKIGLREWYPNAKPIKASRSPEDDGDANDGNDETEGVSE